LKKNLRKPQRGEGRGRQPSEELEKEELTNFLKSPRFRADVFKNKRRGGSKGTTARGN